MLIRSQDKSGLVNYDNSLSIEIYTTSIYSINENSSRLLGKYSTEEKALKVLDEIQAKYKQTLKAQIAIFNFPKVYEMPEDTKPD